MPYVPDPEELASWHEHILAEVRAQGLPDHVEDEGALDRIAALFARFDE